MGWRQPCMPQSRGGIHDRSEISKTQQKAAINSTNKRVYEARVSGIRASLPHEVESDAARQERQWGNSQCQDSSHASHNRWRPGKQRSADE